MVDALSARPWAPGYVALFQAAGMAIFIALLGRPLIRTREASARPF